MARLHLQVGPPTPPPDGLRGAVLPWTRPEDAVLVPILLFALAMLVIGLVSGRLGALRRQREAHKSGPSSPDAGPAE